MKIFLYWKIKKFFRNSSNLEQSIVILLMATNLIIQEERSPSWSEFVI